MHDNLSFGTFAVVTEGCPITHSVSGSDSASFIMGELPKALEMQFDYPSMRKMASATAEALDKMRTLHAELYGEELVDDEPDAAAKDKAAGGERA